MNHCLKFANEITAIGAMTQFYRDDWDRTCVDPIGTVMKPTGALTPDGDPVMVDVGGFHLNLICDELPKALKQFEVFPTNPVRVWA
jgi:hypothetical protein